MTTKRWLAVATWPALLAGPVAYAPLLLNDPKGILDNAGTLLDVIVLVFGTTGLVLDQVDVDTLVNNLLEVVDEAVVPEGAAVWVRQPSGAR